MGLNWQLRMRKTSAIEGKAGQNLSIQIIARTMWKLEMKITWA